VAAGGRDLPWWHGTTPREASLPLNPYADSACHPPAWGAVRMKLRGWRLEASWRHGESTFTAQGIEPGGMRGLLVSWKRTRTGWSTCGIAALSVDGGLRKFGTGTLGAWLEDSQVGERQRNAHNGAA
jgi:hypothetical protein